jgi:hypothetical protein
LGKKKKKGGKKEGRPINSRSLRKIKSDRTLLERMRRLYLLSEKKKKKKKE